MTRRSSFFVSSTALFAAVLVCCGFLLYSPDQQESLPIEYESVSWDHHAAASAALDALAVWVAAQPQPAPEPPPNTPVTRTETQALPSGSVWDALAECESGGRWDIATGNGYGGGLQFAHTTQWSTWRAFGGVEFAAHPWDATREQQIVVAERVLARSGWGAWPGCARRLGLL